MEMVPDDIIDVSENESCRRLDQLLDAVGSGSLVLIKRGGERVAVILREDMFEHYEGIEDSLWASRAADADHDADQGTVS